MVAMTVAKLNVWAEAQTHKARPEMKEAPVRVDGDCQFWAVERRIEVNEENYKPRRKFGQVVFYVGESRPR